MHETVKHVVSYQDDVHVWVYVDQVDRVLRYEAYVLGYDDQGCPATLDFVLEEGVLDNLHEIPLFADLMRDLKRRGVLERPAIRFSDDGRLLTTPLVLNFYPALTEPQRDAVHSFFNHQEIHLKQEKRRHWTRMLKALGYDVIAAL